MDRYPGLLERRMQIMKRYDETCENLGISHMVHHTSAMDSSNHLYLIRIPGIDVEDRNRIIERMAEKGVATNGLRERGIGRKTAHRRGLEH